MSAKFRFACHLITWEGEQRENPEKVLREVADAGYEGVEGLGIRSAEELIEMAKLAAKYGLHLVNAGGATPESKIDHNITLGNNAAEIPARRRVDFARLRRCRSHKAHRPPVGEHALALPVP